MSEEKIVEAGKIGATAREFGAKFIKAGVPLVEIAEKVEEKIYSMGGKIAFPVNISRNHVAAHATPLPGETTVFGENDVVRLDVGVHIDGWVADSAVCIDLSGKYKELVEASRKALENAIKKVKPGVAVGEIGATIQETITSKGFSPIRNLSGHLIEQWNVHAGITIPNFNNRDPTPLEEGMQIAIEPFATDGEGIITEGKGGGIYHIQNLKPVRNPTIRKILEQLHNEHRTLYFSKRMIDVPMRDYAFTQMEKEGILYQHPELVERAKGIVTQFEHTMIVKKNGALVTTQI